MDDGLLPERIEPEIADLSLFKGKIRHYELIDSTNTLALAHAEQGDPEGSVFIAEEQSQGRGKPGRAWYSKRGDGIYVSLLLRPKVAPIRVPTLTLLTAVAVVETLLTIFTERAGLSPAAAAATLDVKWPNDVLLNGHKVCGILSEMALSGHQVQHAVVGIGLNVHQERFPPPLDQLATSLFIETGQHIPRVEILVRLLKSFETWYNQFLNGSFDKITARWSELSSYAYDRPITVEKDGSLLSGITRGLNAQGALLLEQANGQIETVWAGDILG